jgi:hypothetical protein
MVQILPSFALVHQSLIRDFLGRSHLFVGHLVQNLKSLTSYQALMVSGEDIWGLELCVQNSISEDFLHHFFLGSLAIGASNIVALGDLGNWFTILELAAFNTEGLSLVRCALFAHDVSVLSKVGVEVRPTTLTALCQVVAVEEELGRKLLHLLPVLELETRFHHLCEGYRIAGATRLLITDLTCEVVTTNTAPVPSLWDLPIRDFFGRGILLLETQRKLMSGGEVGSFAKDLGISLCQLNLLVTVGSIVLMVLLQLADVGLPSEVGLVDG